MLERFEFRHVSTFAVMFPVMVLIVLSEFFLVASPNIGSRELEQVQLIRTVLETCLMSHDIFFLHVCAFIFWLRHLLSILSPWSQDLLLLDLPWPGRVRLVL